MKKITTIKRFLRVCREIRTDYEFQLVETPLRVPASNGKGTVGSCAIYYISDSKSLWTPLEVVYHHLNHNKPWCHSLVAAQRIGLPENKANEIILACGERKGHLLALRSKILQCFNLQEFHHKYRVSYRRHGNEKRSRRK